jgi:hypothetical protein
LTALPFILPKIEGKPPSCHTKIDHNNHPRTGPGVSSTARFRVEEATNLMNNQIAMGSNAYASMQRGWDGAIMYR